MSLSMKKSSFLLLLLLFLSFAKAQNIYDLKNSKKYAESLYSSHEYELAAREFERIVFLDSSNAEARLLLIKSFRKAGKIDKAITRAKKFFPSTEGMPEKFAGEYSKLLIHSRQYKACENFINTNTQLPAQDKKFYLATSQMFRTDWQQANNTLTADTGNYSSSYERLLQLNNQALNMKYKKPWLSLGLSAIIPGMGKVYSGYWKDGLVSLLFVGLSGWQAYRGFDQNGMKSAYGWIYSGISFGFYLGNLYGSGKAANKFNDKQNRKIFDQVEKIYINY
ncbi:MAG: hypothetical protein ACOCPM_01150 [Bacteroidales bacterium]